LDGHHRFQACRELGIKEPKTTTRDFENRFEEKIFVIECNLRRRQLNHFQRGELALKSKQILEEVSKQNQKAGVTIDTSAKHLTQVGRVDQEIGKRAGISHETVRKIETLKEKAPEYVKEKLRAGDVTISQAFGQYGGGSKKQGVTIQQEQYRY
jgi:hypothetical protein